MKSLTHIIFMACFILSIYTSKAPAQSKPGPLTYYVTLRPSDSEFGQGQVIPEILVGRQWGKTYLTFRPVYSGPYPASANVQQFFTRQETQGLIDELSNPTNAVFVAPRDLIILHKVN